MVAENRGNCSTQQCERAHRARKLHHSTDAPTTRNFRALLDGNTIGNCPATADDVKIAEGTWGKDLSCLKALATRPKPDPVRMHNLRHQKNCVKSIKKLHCASMEHTSMAWNS